MTSSPIYKGFNEKVSYHMLSQNENAIEQLIKISPDKVDWIFLSKNPNVYQYIQNNLDKISRYSLAHNNSPYIREILKREYQNGRIEKGWIFSSIHLIDEIKELIATNYSYINWTDLSLNEHPDVEEILLNNFNKIHWGFLCRNPAPWAIKILEENPDKIDWFWLPSNPSAIHIIESRIDEIVQINPEAFMWENLCFNPAAKHLIERYYEHIDWNALSANPLMIDLIEKNIDKVNYVWLSKNKNAIHLLMNLNYDAMKEKLLPFSEELAQKVFNPSRIERLSLKYGISPDKFSEIF